jgi:chromosome segregation ATPase
MSNEDIDGNKPEVVDVDGSDVNVTITVDKSTREEELQQQLEKEKTDKLTANKKLEELNTEVEDLKKAGKDKEEEYEEKLTEMQGYKDQVHDLAIKAFDRKKDTYNTKLTESGMEKEKIDEIMEGIQKPDDLDNAEMYLTLISDMMGKAQEDIDAAEKEKADAQEAAQAAQNDPVAEQAKLDKLAEQANADAQGGGVVNLDIPTDATGNYPSHIEAIDDLYSKLVKGDKKAIKELKGLWVLAIKKLKEERVDFSVSQCPRCGGGMDEKGVCPYCGFTQDDYLYKGKLWE